MKTCYHGLVSLTITLIIHELLVQIGKAFHTSFGTETEEAQPLRPVCRSDFATVEEKPENDRPTSGCHGGSLVHARLGHIILEKYQEIYSRVKPLLPLRVVAVLPGVSLNQHFPLTNSLA